MATASDNFNRANANPIGGNWTDYSQPSGNLEIVSNAVTVTSSLDDREAYWNANTFGNDQFSEAAVTVGAGSFPGAGMGVAIRQSGTGSTRTEYRLVAQHGTSNNVELCKFVSNSFTLLADWTHAFTNGDVLHLEATSTTLTAIFGGTTLGTHTDSSVTSGHVGLSYSSDTTTASADNWAGGDVGGGGSALTQNVNDSVTMSDATAMAIATTLTDSATMSDTLAMGIATTLTDSVTLADLAAMGIATGFSDSVTLADANAMGIGTSVSDSVALSDSQAFGIGLALSDSLTLADQTSFGIGLSLSDSTALADNDVESLGGSGLTQSINDSVTLSDALTFGIGLVLDDATTTSDALAMGLSIQVSDSITVADATAMGIGLALAESLGLADSTGSSSGIGMEVDDAVALVDGLIVSFGFKLADAITVADGLSFLLNGQPLGAPAKAHVRSYFVTKFGFYT